MIRNKYSYQQFELNEGSGRELPLMLKIQVFIGGVLGYIGIFFTLMGGLFLFSFATMVNFNQIYISNSSPTVIGEITEINQTNASSNKKDILAYHYRYSVSGKEYQSISYIEENVKVDSSNCIIIYNSDKPEYSVIKGMRTSIFEPWVLLAISPFLIIGLIATFISMRKGKKALFLLKFGDIAFGKFLYKEATNTKINKRTVYRMFFEFTAKDGKAYKVHSSTHIPEALQDEAEEKLVYNSQNPNEAVLIDSLPKVVKLFFNANF